jgi:hypothetical protein
MMLLWLVVGIVLVATAFFIPGESIELWPSLNASGIAAGIYLVALVAYTMRAPFPRKTRIVTWACFLLTSGAVLIAWTGMDSTSHWQRRTLVEIRRTIGQGIMQATIRDTLFRVLELYYAQEPKKKESVGLIFQQLHPGMRAGTHFPPEYEGAQPTTFIGAVSDHEIVLVGQEMYVKGRDPGFKNYDGKTGMLQARATLTEKGLKYESEN